jgi:hypothetical protein
MADRIRGDDVEPEREGVDQRHELAGRLAPGLEPDVVLGDRFLERFAWQVTLAIDRALAASC